MRQAVDSSGNVLRQNNYAYGEAVADTDEYDANTEKITLTSLIDGSTNRKVEAFVDPWGLTRKTIVYNGSEQYVTTYKYDKYNALVSMTDPNSNASDKAPTVSYEYDYNMNVIKETNALGDSVTSTYNALGQLVESTDYKGNETEYTYDGVGNLVRTTSPIDNNNTAETLQYYDAEGFLAREKIKTDTNAYRETDYTYDELGRLSAVIKDETTGDNYTKYFYDVKGNPIKVVTGLTADCTETTIPDTAAVTQYEYHPYFNSITKITKPEGEIQYFNYDLFGLLTEQGYTKNNSNSGQIYYTYDILGQLLSKTAGNKTESFTYDKLGNVLQTTDDSGITTYTYDTLGRLTEESRNDGIKKQYTYDANNNRKSFKFYTNNYILQQNLGYVYDDLNRVTSITETGTQIASYTYNKNSNLLTENNVILNTAYTYNSGNLVTKKVTNNSENIMFQQDVYTYNADGNVNHYNDAGYVYDSQNRLVIVTRPNMNYTDYFFDSFGNRSTMINSPVPVSYTYDKNNRILSQSGSEGTTNYSYDVRGNLSLKTVSASDTDSQMFEFDGFNRMSGFETGDITAEYKYNSDGLRTAKTVNGDTTDFVLDGMNVIAEITDSGVTNYVRGLTGIVYRKTPDGAKTYYITNNHGDVVQLVAQNFQVIQIYTYDEYGNVTYSSGNDPNPFLYCGEYCDEESGLIYLRARYYSPQLGRFISEDPARDDLNWYAYCGSNPINFWDPLGLASYILYHSEWEEEANAIKQDFVDAGINEDEIILVATNSNQGFIDAWNNMDETVDYVAIVTHAAPTYLKSSDSSLHITTDDIAKLYDKNVSVMFLTGCNAGHLDYANSNVAYAFSLKTNGGVVFASDGTVSSRKYVHAMGVDDYYYTSYPNLEFESLCIGSKKRVNQGWLMYRNAYGSILEQPRILGTREFNIDCIINDPAVSKFGVLLFPKINVMVYKPF